MRKQYTDRYVCPFCCKVVDPERFHRVCHNPRCLSEFVENCSPAARNRRVSKFQPGLEIDVEKSLYNGIDPQSTDAITTREHIVYPVKSTRCDICGKDLPDAICPICHSPIPPDHADGSNIISVLGAAMSGKSNYTASLIEVMRTAFCAEYDAEMKPAVPRTDEVYNLLCERLARGDYEENCTSEPMVYYITENRDETRSVHTLALFDTAGADLESEGRMESVSTGTLITGSAGIIFLVDPLSIPEVRRRLRMPEVPAPDHASRLNEIADTIRLSRHRLSRDVELPLAVVLTKVDILMRAARSADEENVLFGPESSLNIPRVRGVYDEENLMQVSEEIEEYLRRFLGDAFIRAVNRFKPHAYFAASALGHDATLQVKPEPFRVEDPLVWLFNYRDE